MTIEYKDSKRIISSPSEYKIHTFNADSTFTLSSGSGDINYVIIGGGAGGGGASHNTDAGGGGAGQYKTGTLAISSARGYTIDVGAGGAGGATGTVSNGTNGTNGSYSRFDDGGAQQIQSDGGGYGAGQRGVAGNSGGSGGGGGGVPASNPAGSGGSANGTGTNAGGNGDIRDGGGGGGAGGAGTNASSGAGTGHGGIGIVNPLSGSTSGVLSGGSYYFAAGGGGGRANGGTGGGGVGSQGSGNSPVSGTGVANTGSGGGGGHENYDAGGAGGTGVVIISYVNDGSITATGGTITTGGSAVQSKPTDVQDNSILVEKDTARRYWFDAALAPTMSNDVYESTSGWTNTTGGDMAIDTTNKGVTYTDVNVGDTGIGRAIGTTLSNSKWLVQFTLEVADWNTNDAGLVSLTDDHTQGFKVSGLNTVTFMPQGASYWRFVLMSGQTNSYAEDPSPNSKFAVNTQYWVDMYRDGTIVKCKVWTNSGRTGTPHWTSNNLTVGSNADDLTGIQHWNENTADIDIGTCWIREVKVYDGVTSATPATWNMEPTFRDDFDTDDWDNMSSRINVNTTTEKLDFAMYRDGANDSAVYDLGAGNVSDTAWVLRWKMNFTAVYASGNGNRLWFGLSSLPQTTNQNTAQDSIMMYQNHDGTDCFSASYSNNAALPQTNTENPDYATGTDYYCELKRTSSTTIESRMWTGGYDGTLLSNAEDSVSNSTIGSVTGLRYVKMSNIYASQGGSVITGTIDDLEFYNGVTSIN